MTVPRRSDAASPEHAPVPRPSPWAPDGGYLPGGPVGSMQADLSRRLAGEGAGETDDSARGERVVRFLSVAGGYLALAAGYAVAALLLLR